MPSWFEQDDPWLTKRMRQVAEIAAAEAAVGTALEQALALFLAGAAARVLAPGSAATVPDLAAWPERERAWQALVTQLVWGVLDGLFTARFKGTVTVTVTFNEAGFLSEFLDQVWQGLQLLPELVFNEVREEIGRSVGAGDPATRTRARVAGLLRIDAPNASLSAQIAALEATIADQASPTAVRREARARLAALRRREDRWSRRWWPKTSELARTLAVSVLNAATTAAGEAMSAAGRQTYKQWWSTQDSAVRDAHRRAHGQTRPMDEKFTVGGFSMDFPGDPTAPSDLVTNCRCSVLMLSAAEGQAARRRYESSRLLASGNPEGGVDVAEETEVVTIVASAATATWRGVLAPMGVRSGDNRMLASPDGEPSYRTLPLPLLYQRATAEGHDNSVVVGSIDRVWSENGMLMGEGRFNVKSDVAQEVIQQIQDGFHRWVSVRIDNETREFRYYRDGREMSAFEVSQSEDTTGIEAVSVASKWRLMSATLVAEPAFQEATISVLSAQDAEEVVTAAGVSLEFDTWEFDFPEFDADASIEIPEQRPPVDEDEFAAPTAEKRERADKSGAALPGGRYPIENESDLRKAIHAVGRAGGPSGSSSDRSQVRRHIIKRARALGLSNLIPDTWASDGSLKTSSMQADGRKQSFYEQVAASVPLEPPAEWFADPQLTGPCKMRVTEDGRVYGHIAAWDTEHAALPGITPPRAADRSYGKFHRHPVRCEDGSRIKTGPLAGNKHAPVNERSLWAVQRHYDDPTHVIADVVCGEDEHGIWVSGALRYGVAPWQVMFADRYSFSGDWRNGELLAACLASVPGFHLDGDDEVQALAACAAADVLADMVPVMELDRDGEVLTLVAAGALSPAPLSTPDAEIAVKLRFGDDPDEFGRQLGRAMFAGLREAEDAEREAARQVVEQEQMAVLVKEFERRVFASRDAEVARLRERVLGKVNS